MIHHSNDVKLLLVIDNSWLILKKTDYKSYWFRSDKFISDEKGRGCLTDHLKYI